MQQILYIMLYNLQIYVLLYVFYVPLFYGIRIMRH